jgi:RHS repeat-associated protein
MQMQLASIPALSQPPLAAMPQLSEKPHLGFATKKTTWNPGPNVCNFTVTLGLQVAVVENGVRKTYSARYYNPNTGRFLSRDPKEFNPLKSRNIPVDSRKLHRYLYASGDPVNRIDPRGREDLDEDSALTMIVKMAEFAPVAMAEAIGFCTLAATLYEIEEPGATPADVLFFYQACLATLI